MSCLLLKRQADLSIYHACRFGLLLALRFWTLTITSVPAHEVPCFCLDDMAVCIHEQATILHLNEASASACFRLKKMEETVVGACLRHLFKSKVGATSLSAVRSLVF